MFATLQANFAGFDVPLAKRLRISETGRQRLLGSVSKSNQQLNRCRFLFLGDSRAGKTSTVRSLTGEEFNPGLERTQGVETCFVDEKWRSIADSELCNAETIVAKAVAEEVTKRERCKLFTERSAHDNYRALFNKLFFKLWLCSGRSNVAMALIFYCVLTIAVSVFGLWKVAIFDLAAFVVLTIYSHRKAKLRKGEYTYVVIAWLGIFRGFCLGIVIGKHISYLVVSCLELSHLKMELVSCLLLAATLEFLLLLGNETRFKMPRMWNIVETAELSSRDTGKFFHSAILGATLCMAGLHEVAGFQLIICNILFTSVLVLRVLILMHLEKVSVRDRVLTGCLLVVEVFIVINHVLTNNLNNAIIFVIIDFVSYASLGINCRNEATSLTNPSKSLVVTRVLLDSQTELKKAIAEIQEMKLQLVDFAGDCEYYCYHHIFLTDEAVYGVVFNIQLLIETTKDEFEQAVKRLRFWLESICIHAPPECAVFLIATHCDGTTEEQLVSVDSRLRDELWKSFKHKFIVAKKSLFFAVENSNGPKDNGICELRQKVLHVARNDCRFMFEQNVPLSWIRLEDKILEMRSLKESSRHCVPLDILKEIAKPCMVEEQQVSKVLEYLFKKGLVMFVKATEDPAWVLIQPSLLTDIVIQLITQSSSPDDQDRLYRNDWHILRDSGKLSSNLLSKILSKFDGNDEQQAIEALLQEYNIICRLTLDHTNQKEDITHFVPALLPKSSPTRPVWIVHPDDAKFYVSFERFLPEAMFHCLMAHAYKRSKLWCPTDYPDLKCDDGQFWLHAKQSYRLTLLKEENLVEVTLCREPGCLGVGEALLQIAEMVNTVRQTSFKHLKFKCGPSCPSPFCPGEPSDRETLGGVPACTRRHVFNVYPRCKEGKGEVSFCCKNKSYSDELSDWQNFG